MATREMRGSERRRAHVLIVDDAVAVRHLVRDVLEEAGYRTSLAAAPLDIDAIKRHAPDLLILDPMVGSAGHGWHLLRRLRADPATAGLPVIVCTGAVRRVREEHGFLAEQAMGLVLKPFDMDELVGEVDSQLAHDAPSAA